MFTHEEYDRMYKRCVDANVRIGELLEENRQLKLELSKVPAFGKGGVITTNETIVIGGKDKETIVPLNKGTGYSNAVTGMYKREWSEPDE